MSHFIVRWKAKSEDVWHNSASWRGPMTREQAEEVLARDKAYFYSDVEIELVEVTEAVVIKTNGSQNRLS